VARNSDNGGSDTLALLLWVVGAVLLVGGGAVVYTMTRGLRNNNPGNITYNSDPSQQWVGLANPPTDGTFCIFTDVTYGIRAMDIILTNKFNQGMVTISQIIMSWAPPSSNNTAAYITAVSQSMGIDPDANIDLTDPTTMQNLIAAIISQENGLNPYDAGTIQSGMALA
jgi:hypothetical protein